MPHQSSFLELVQMFVRLKYYSLKKIFQRGELQEHFKGIEETFYIMKHQGGKEDGRNFRFLRAALDAAARLLLFDSK